MALCKKAEQYLKDAGWKPKHEKDINIYTKGLELEGYTINNYAKDFLREFGGLEAKQPAFRVPNEFDKLHFDPLKASAQIYRERVETYEERTGESLVVVGEAYNEHLILMISDSGKMYGAYDNYLTLLGRNWTEALNSMYQCEQTDEIK